MRIIVLGHKGMLGSQIANLLQNKSDIHLFVYDLDDIDVTKEQDVMYLAEKQPDIIINCTAYADVDRAESDVYTAYKVNGYALNNIVKLALKTDSVLVHYSTDYVFDGTTKKIWQESDVTSPVSIYGKSKLIGEKIIENSLSKDQYLILRTAWLYGENGKNFVATMLSIIKSELNVVNDQFGCPTYTKDLAMWTMDLLQNKDRGVFHAVNKGSCSWYEFAKEIFSLVNIVKKINPVDTSLFFTPAKRPASSVLDINKLTKTLGYPPRDWKLALKDYLHASYVGKG